MNEVLCCSRETAHFFFFDDWSLLFPVPTMTSITLPFLDNAARWLSFDRCPGGVVSACSRLRSNVIVAANAVRELLIR